MSSIGTSDLFGRFGRLVQGGPKERYESGAYNRFDYYSGSQITVWFGDILIDDIYAIQWQRQQAKRPIFGYASQTFDCVANGTISVVGAFTVNFRQRGYISMIINEISKIYSLKTNQNWNEIRKLVSLHLRHDTFGPKTAEDIAMMASAPNFAELADAYEQEIWGPPPGKGVGVGLGGDGGFGFGVHGSSGAGISGDGLIRDYEPPDIIQRKLIPDGFNILITYGNQLGDEAKTLRDKLQTTTKTLIGVHLLGESQAIQVGGNPCMEEYSFMARSTDEFIGITQ
jgi:hypothetical protein